MSKGNDRPYAAGRSTEGFTRGERIERVSDVKPGDLLIGVSHQFEAVNLYRVVGFKTKRGLALDPMIGKMDREIFYAVYVNPDGTIYPNDVQEMCGELVTRAVWGSDLAPKFRNLDEWFKAVSTVAKPTLQGCKERFSRC